MAAGFVLWFSVVRVPSFGADPQPGPDERRTVPGTRPLTLDGDLGVQMVERMHPFLLRRISSSPERRRRHWNWEFISHEAYVNSIEANRQRFRRLIGAVDPRIPVRELILIETTERRALLLETDHIRVHAVRWPVFPGVFAEGLWLEPLGQPRAQIVAVPDADQTPEMLAGLAPGVEPESQFARRLAETGCRVLVPVLIDRDDKFSGNPQIGRLTNQPHREYIYRQAFELGRHVIGYEVQKVQAAVDWFVFKNEQDGMHRPIAVMGYGEGGLIAFYSAAVDPRIAATVVSGYFQPREAIWQEPVYRNVWGLLEEFGDAEVAALVAPRGLIVEACRTPEIEGPPAERPGRRGAPPGIVTTPALDSVAHEFEKASVVYRKLDAAERIQLVVSEEGIGPPGSAEAIRALAEQLGVELTLTDNPPPPAFEPAVPIEPQRRMQRQVSELVEHTQRLMRGAKTVRREFWKYADRGDADRWRESCERYRDFLWDEVIGRTPEPDVPLNPRSRLILDQPNWRGYEVVFDVWPDVFAYGILLIPKDLADDERRPVVV